MRIRKLPIPVLLFSCSVLICTMLYISCQNTGTTKQSKKVEIGFHRTIETVMILRALSGTDYFISRIPDTSKGRPMLYKARKYFANFKNHPAVSETQRILQSTQDIGGVLFQGVLLAKELPESSMLAEPADGYWTQHRDELKSYLKVLSTFYKEANVEGFFEQNKDFYQGAIWEAHGYINDSITVVMEDYFGKQNKAYVMYILPLSPYGWGFSCTVPVDGGENQCAIVSPVSNIEWDETQTETSEFGFGGSEARVHYGEIVVHEFVHSFVTNVLELDSFKTMINETDSLYTPLLDSVFGEQGYSGWWNYVNEHIVRLGHIRVASLLDKDEANELRNLNAEEYTFVFVPDAEELIKEYENNRSKYKTIDDFLPVLVRQFQNMDRATIDNRIKAYQNQTSASMPETK